MFPAANGIAAAALALGALLAAAPLHAQSPAAPPRAQVMVLGSYHMGATPDYVRKPVDDVRSDRRQREIEAVVARLAEWRPTRIALEVPLARDSALNAAYAAYRAGERVLEPSESEQIGFRLARRLGHERVYAVDYELDEPFRRFLQFAAQHGHSDFLARASAAMQQMLQEFADRQQRMTVGELLLEENSPRTDSLHALYIMAAAVAHDTSYAGADLVAIRYERNLKIYANIARVAAPGERVLVIYGAGHGKLLREFVAWNPELELVDVTPFLASRAASVAPR